MTAPIVEPGVQQEIRFLIRCAREALLDASNTQSWLKRQEKIAVADRQLARAEKLWRAMP